MTSRRVLVGLVLIAVLAVWWASGLGRPSADPRSYFTEDQIARARSYQTPKQWGYLASTVLGVAVLAVLAFTPVGGRVLRPFRSWPSPLAWAGAAAAITLMVAVARLPLSFWRGHLHERTWGFSTQSASAWFVDWAKAVGIRLVLTGLVFAGLVALIRGFPRVWPVLAGAGGAALVVGLTFAGPVLFEPLFNRFTPLEDRAMARELESLADRAGVPVKEVLVADASRRTTKENAYVSGFGSTKRLVVYDTLLERADPDEVRLVVAHELGHRRERHVELGTALGAVGAALAVVVVWLALRSASVLSAAGASGTADVRVVPLILLVAAVLSIATLPPNNWISRRFETAADRFALRLSGEREVYVRTELELAIRNLSDLDPGPVSYRFLFTHPAPAERIVLAG